MRWVTAFLVSCTLVAVIGLATSAQAAPAMFQASFIFHAWGNDISGGATHRSAMPLGYDCHHASPTTVYDPRYCSPAKRQRGHPATGTWTRSFGSGTPPAILLQQSDIGVTVAGYRPATRYQIHNRTFAIIVNDAGSFFAGGGPAAYGTVTKTSIYSMYPMASHRTGTWRIYPGKNAFGGAMGLLGFIRTHQEVCGSLPTCFPWGVGGSLPIIPAIGHPLFNTIISYGPGGTTYFQNPYTTDFNWHAWSSSAGDFQVLGSATLWTTGRVQIRFQQSQTGPTTTIPTRSVSRTGYDNRTAGGLGNIQLVTPTLVHRAIHTPQIGVLTIQVPEPWEAVLLITGIAMLCGLYRLRRR